MPNDKGIKKGNLYKGSHQVSSQYSHKMSLLHAEGSG